VSTKKQENKRIQKSKATTGEIRGRGVKEGWSRGEPREGMERKTFESDVESNFIYLKWGSRSRGEGEGRNKEGVSIQRWGGGSGVG